MKSRDITSIALFVAFISVSAQISIPVQPVPFTLQTTLVLMAGLILGSKKGLIACLIYILIGAVGFPVFANAKGGFGVIFMQTGGFIMSFPVVAFVTGKFTEVSTKSITKYIGCMLAVTINFICGCIYFMFFTKMNLYTSLTYVVFPFVITTFIQIVLAIILSDKINKIIK